MYINGKEHLRKNHNEPTKLQIRLVIDLEVQCPLNTPLKLQAKKATLKN